jgi:GH24 family phage-related lysozyme (muramidase)
VENKINRRHAGSMPLWMYGGGKVLPGLLTRREAKVMLLICINCDLN